MRTAFANAGMSPTINGNFLCNPYTINVPKPYGKNVPNADTYSASVSSCNCDQWAKIKAEISAATTGGPYDITSMASVNSYLLANYGDVLSTELWNGLQQCTNHDWQKTVCYPTSGSGSTTSSTTSSSSNNNGGQNCFTVPNPITIGTDQNPVYIPVFLGCNYVKPCMSCVQLAQYTTDFLAIYPFYLGVPFTVDANTTDARQNANSLWARYINYKTGFSLTASVYAAAMSSCGSGNPGGGGGLCVSDLQLTDRASQPPTTATAQAQYTASTSIEFLPGYTSQTNDNFIAQIAPCDGSGGSSSTAVAVCCNTFAANHVTAAVAGTVPTNPCQKQLDDAAAAAHLIIALRATYYKAQFDAQYLATCLGAKDHELFTAAYQPSEYHYTLYYYNQAGNLVKTVPPAGVKPNYDPVFLASVKTARDAQPQTTAQLITPNASLITSYRHNSLNQAVAQNSPDGGTSQFWYDRLGRLAVSQNAKQAVDGNYSYTLYDPLGRITEVGQKPLAAPYIAMAQTISQDPALLESWINGNPANKQQMTRTTYDLAYGPGLAPYITQQNLRNRVSYTEVWDYGFEQYASAATYYSYDIHGNVDNLLQDYGSSAGQPNVMNTVNGTPSGNRFKKLSYSYDLISGKVNMVAYQPPLQDQTDPSITYPNADAFYHRYSYDAENRLTYVEVSRDNILWENMAKYAYYRHGPLANTLLGNERVQRITNAYTIQGWMKGIVPEVQTDPFIAKQAFNYGLGYFDGDYTPIAGTNPFAAINQGANLYNGNIRAMLVNIPILGEPILHSYSYDQLNRIKAVNNFNGYVSTTNSWTATDAHKETLSFDPNGNIQKALLNGPATNLPNEDFTYNYDPVKQNRLLSISNAVNNTVSNYTYNEIGEVTRDELQNNTYFQWTVYGKLEKLVKANGTHLSYTYGPDGKRISKEVANSPTKDFTEFYVRDASGNIMATYQKDATVNGGHLSIKGFNMYGSNMIGTWDKTVDVETPSRPAVTAFIRGEQELFVGNHLGNNMLVLTDRKNQHSSDGINVDYYTPSIASATDYSAYGEDLIGREFNSGSISFGFNGKMNDAESGYQDYGERDYDGKKRGFEIPDPLEQQYPHYTPYQFAGNTPLQAIDLDGLEPWNVTFNGKSGNSVAVVTIYGPYKDAAAAQSAVNRGWVTKQQLHKAYADDIRRRYINGPIAKIDKANAKMGEAYMKSVDKVFETGNLLINIFSFFVPAAKTTSPLLKEGEVVAQSGVKDMQEVQVQADKSIAPIPLENTTTNNTIYRTQGGVVPNASQTRISINENGGVSIEGDQMLYVTLNDRDHQVYFYNKRGGDEKGASIVSFEIPTSLAKEIETNAVPQAQGKQFPNSPQISDLTKSTGAYGLPKTFIDKLRQQAIPGSGKIETPK